MKTIIVACGGGIATSATVASKLERLLEQRGFGRNKVHIEPIHIMQLDSYVNNNLADMYVSITSVREGGYKIPVFNGISFITGIGMEEELDKIVEALKK